jgi:hypothetical protein
VSFFVKELSSFTEKLRFFTTELTFFAGILTFSVGKIPSAQGKLRSFPMEICLAVPVPRCVQLVGRGIRPAGDGEEGRLHRATAAR